MKTKICPICGSEMKRNGFNSSGRQRWRCKSCNKSETHKRDNTVERFEEFLNFLFSKQIQIDMKGQGRTFRRRTREFWDIWPLPDVVDEIHRVIYVDGIYIKRNLVVLIACSDDHVLSWYLARAETSRAWEALLENIAPPDVVVTDGGTGFGKAVKKLWPNTKIQRCLFHVFNQVKRYTTTRPNLACGVELYSLAKELLHLDNLHQAMWWIERYMQWCEFWYDFLEEKSLVEGRREYLHLNLRKARESLSRLVNQGTLFTYLDPDLAYEGVLPRTNNRIEGGINAQLRAMLREHRGMSDIRRIKAVFWWCYMHIECPKTPSEILTSMPTDSDIDALYKTYAIGPKREDGGPEWGDRAVWEEFHYKTRYPYAID